MKLKKHYISVDTELAIRNWISDNTKHGGVHYDEQRLRELMLCPISSKELASQSPYMKGEAE